MFVHGQQFEHHQAGFLLLLQELAAPVLEGCSVCRPTIPNLHSDHWVQMCSVSRKLEDTSSLCLPLLQPHLINFGP